MSEHSEAMKALRQLDSEFLECRRGSGIGHAWRTLGWWTEAGENRRLSACARCEGEKVDRWDKQTGERHPARYKMPESYAMPEQPAPFEVRLEVMRRVVRVYSSQESMIRALTEGKGRK